MHEHEGGQILQLNSYQTDLSFCQSKESLCIYRESEPCPATLKEFHL